MNHELNFFADEDIEVIRRLIAWAKRQPLNTPYRDNPSPNTDQMPSVYMVKAPDGGIPALVEHPTGQDVPGAAFCKVYRELEGKLWQLTHEMEVLNLSTTAVAANALKSAVMDRFGRYVLVEVTAGGGSSFRVSTMGASPLSTSHLKLPSNTLVDNGDGTVTLGRASPSLNGLVSYENQDLSGNKVLNPLGAAGGVGSAWISSGLLSTHASFGTFNSRIGINYSHTGTILPSLMTIPQIRTLSMLGPSLGGSLNLSFVGSQANTGAYLLLHTNDNAGGTTRPKLAVEYDGVVMQGEHAIVDGLTFRSGLYISGSISISIGQVSGLGGLAGANTVDNTVWSGDVLTIVNGGTSADNADDARANLGCGTAAVANIEFFLQSANDLSDLASAITARTNLGLGALAVLNVAADVDELTDSSGGTPGATLNAVSGTGDDATINDNNASINAKLNEIIASLQASGQMAS